MKKLAIVSFLMIFSLVTCLMPLGTADASTSRVAIISSWEGTVEVQKSGGKKTFKAFKNMSLNQGDIITTGKKSTAVLKFSNGTSEDDTLTLEENSTVTFTKLKNASGTTTKVRIKQGKAWVDVKSIKNKNDEFTLETPTAIMGVRGTNFFVGLDPNTGAMTMAVLSGIVTVNDNRENVSDDMTAFMEHVYPSMIMTQIEDYISTRTITNADSLAEFMTPTSEEVIRRILDNFNEVKRENDEFIENLRNSEVPSDLGLLELSLDDYYYNITNVIEFILGAFVEKDYISADRMNEIINEVNQNISGSGIKVLEPDFRETNRTTELYRQEQERLKRLEEAKQQLRERESAAADKKEELKRQAEQQRQQLEEMQEKRRQEAEAAYLERLSAAERAAYEANKREREQEDSRAPRPTQTPSNSSPSPTRAPAPDWASLSTPFVVKANVAGDDVTLAYERQEGAEAGEFIGVEPIVIPATTSITIPVTGDYEVTSVTNITSSPVQIDKSGDNYYIQLSEEADELALKVTVRDQASRSTYTYEVRYIVVYQQEQPEAPDWESIDNPFTVYYMSNSGEKKLNYEAVTIDESVQFVGTESIIVEEQSYLSIPATGEYQVTTVEDITFDPIILEKTDDYYYIPLNSQLDELILLITVWDEASDSYHNYQLTYQLIRGLEFSIYTMFYDQQQEEDIAIEVGYEFVDGEGEIPTYRAEKIIAEQLQGYGYIKLVIPNADIVWHLEYGYENYLEGPGAGEYVLYLESSPIEQYDIYVTAIDPDTELTYEYVIELPLHLWWMDSDIVPFKVYDSYNGSELPLEREDDIFVAQVDISETLEDGLILYNDDENDLMIDFVCIVGHEYIENYIGGPIEDGIENCIESDYNSDFGQYFELAFNPDLRAEYYEVFVHKYGSSHSFILKLESVDHWKDVEKPFKLFVGESEEEVEAEVEKTNFISSYFFRTSNPNGHYRIESEDLIILGAALMTKEDFEEGQQGEPGNINLPDPEEVSDGQYEFEIAEEEFVFVLLMVASENEDEIEMIMLLIAPTINPDLFK